MKTFKFYLSLAFCICSTVIWGKSYEQLVLKDGSILEGYISLQHPGKDMVFSAERAIVYIPSERIQSMISHEIPTSSLAPAWKEWINENPLSVRTQGNTKSITLHDILLKEAPKALKDTTIVVDSVKSKQGHLVSDWYVTPRKVRILETGITIKYLDLTPNTYHLEWSDIQMIKREKRSDLDLSGINDIIVLRSGTYLTGQIVEQRPGKQIHLWKDDGIIEVIDNKQIASQKKEKVNPDQSLFEQVQLQDVVCTKEGNVFTGVIIEQNYGSEKEPSFLLLQDEKGNIHRMNNSSIEEIRKEVNKKYNPLTDVLIQGDEILINRDSAELATMEEVKSVFVISADSKVTRLSHAAIKQKLIIEMNDNPNNHNWILLDVHQSEVKGKGLLYTFTYEDLLRKGSQPTEKVVSIHKTLKMTYTIGMGHYILYNPQRNAAILLYVE